MKYLCIELEQILCEFGLAYIATKLEKRRGIIKKKLNNLLKESEKLVGSRNIGPQFMERVVNLNLVSLVRKKSVCWISV